MISYLLGINDTFPVYFYQIENSDFMWNEINKIQLMEKFMFKSILKNISICELGN